MFLSILNTKNFDEILIKPSLKGKNRYLNFCGFKSQFSCHHFIWEIKPFRRTKSESRTFLCDVRVFSTSDNKQYSHYLWQMHSAC